MRMSYIREFVVCARHLNMRRAASEMLMTQSNLSKHLKQLEAEVGAPLFTYASNRLSLTPVGSRFLEGSTAILDLFEDLQEGCRAYDEAERQEPHRHLTIQQHSLVDETARSYYRLIDTLRCQNEDLVISFAKASRRNFIHELESGNLNLCMDYRYGPLDDIVRGYRDAGLVWHHLHSEPLVLWCDRRHPLNMPGLSPLDLQGVPIMTPGDASAPMKRAVTELCRSYGFEPTFITTPTTSQPEFLNAHQPESVYVYPLSFTETPLLHGFESMTAVPFASEDVRLDSFAVTTRATTAYAPELGRLLGCVDEAGAPGAGPDAPAAGRQPAPTGGRG